MADYEYLNIPKSCVIGNTIFKKLFYENADLSTSDKNLFIDGINKITWLYCLKPETINIKPFRDDVRDYNEIEVIEVVLENETKTKRIAEIIMRTIPYPMLLIFSLGDKYQLFTAHQRINQNDSSKNTIDDFIFTEWLDDTSPLFEKLDIIKMRFTNYFTLYSDIVDVISIYNAEQKIQNTEIKLTGEEARKLTEQIETLEQQIINLRARLKKEIQFNIKMDINIEIKKLEQIKKDIVGGAVVEIR